MRTLLLLTCGVLADQLCGYWAPVAIGSKCSPAQTCCPSDSNFPPGCASLTPTPNLFVTQEDYAFGANLGYSDTYLVSSGNCPINGITDSTLNSGVITYGSYSGGGPNNNITGNWSTVTYQPQTFSATLVKSRNEFFTQGTNVSGTILGPCMNLQTLFNDPDYGCPCGGNWSVSMFGSNNTDPATRLINKTQCVLSNGTSSCPEDYWFSLSPRYGSYRIYNISNNTMRQLDITRPVINQSQGWSDNITYASYTANFSCPAAVTPTPAKSSAGTLSSGVVILAMALCV